MNNIYILIGATIGLFAWGVPGAIAGAIIGWILGRWSEVIASIGKSEKSADWKSIFMRAIIVLAVGAMISIFIGSVSANAEIKNDSATLSTGITGLSDTSREALLGCQVSNGFFTKSGVQYSESGKRIELIRFKRKDGFVWAIPTNFSSLSNVENDIATSLVEGGEVFFVSFSICGNGGYPSLIDLYLP